MDKVVLKTDALHMNEDDFFHFCRENKGLRIERSPNKEIIIMSPSGYETSRLNVKLYFLLETWNRKHQSGVVTDSNGGFVLPNGAMRVPDVAWIPIDRYRKFNKSEREKFLHYCPDFVIELKSPSDHLQEMQDKMDEWMDNGTLLGWLINPENESVDIYRKNKANDTVKGFNNYLDGEEVLPGFQLHLAELR